MLQIVTYNLGGARKRRTPPHDPRRVGADTADLLRRVLDPAAPTVLALQEVGYVRWAGDESRNSGYDALAEALGETYTAHFAAELSYDMHPHPNLWERDTYQHPGGAALVDAAEGNALVFNLSGAAWPWGAAGLPVATQISEASVYSTGNRDTQPRNLQVACVQHPDYGSLYVLNTHLGTVTGEDRYDINNPRTAHGERLRVRQVRQVVRVLRELRAAEQAAGVLARPALLAGDFNAKPRSAAIRVLAEAGFALVTVENPPDEAWTHIGHQILIDHVLLSDPAGVLPTGTARVISVVPDDLSDHRPVVAVFG